MKKLMIATAAAVLAGGAFAAPQVFDFKASVKYMYLSKPTSLKTKTLKGNQYPNDFAGASGKIYIKKQASASLKGYLIQDVDGVTSPTINAASTATGFDYGRNRAFLVVMSSSAEKEFKQPKILPAVIDAKFIDTNFKKMHLATTGLAEGTLYIGGDAVAPVRPQLDLLGNTVDTVVSRGAAPVAPAASTPGMAALADYVWTSCFLFGQYNGPNWFFDTPSGIGAFDAFEAAWDANLPADLQIGFAPVRSFYHDTWMNGAGIGKYTVPSPSTTKAGDLCCGLDQTITVTSYRAILDSLSGSLKGGVFICTDNGIDAAARPGDVKTYRFFDIWEGGRDGWDAQFFSSRISADLVGTEYESAGDSAMDFQGDKWQFDLWQDGPFEQETTDIITGTWSIKRNTKFFAKNGIFARYGVLTDVEIAALAGLDPETAEYEETVLGEELLCGSIKAAAKALKSGVTFCDGNEIYDLNANTQVGNLPVVTPKFAKYYGLANWH